MAKKQGWEKGEGPYAGSKGLGMTRLPDPSNESSFKDSKDISKIVETNAGPDVVAYTSNYTGKK